MIEILIFPYERYNALEAYAGELSPEQVERISDAPEAALIKLSFNELGVEVTIIEKN